MSPIDEVLISQVAALLVEQLSPVALYVFGSVAKGRIGPESDLDLAIFSEKKITFDKQEALKASVLAGFGVQLDLIDFNAAPPTLQAEILRYGRKVFVANDQILTTMIMRALRSYQMLNDERRPILEKRLGADGWKRLF